MTMDHAFMTILGHRYVSGMPLDDQFYAMYEAGRLFGIRQGKREVQEKTIRTIVAQLNASVSISGDEPEYAPRDC
jgi:hypothetical protein